jgi:hypothetical protein
MNLAVRAMFNAYGASRRVETPNKTTLSHSGEVMCSSKSWMMQSSRCSLERLLMCVCGLQRARSALRSCCTAGQSPLGSRAASPTSWRSALASLC